MKNVTYIVPLHVYDDTVAEYLKKAYESLKLNLQKGDAVMFVGPAEVVDKAVAPFNTEKTKRVKPVYNDGETDFFSQVNRAVMFVTTDFFSILEYDDEYLPNWGKNGRLYAENGASVLLPVAVIEDQSGSTHYCNEIAWSPVFKQGVEDLDEEDLKDGTVNDHTLEEWNKQQRLGYINRKGLGVFMDFQMTGGFIKTEDFIAIGGLKPSLKVASWYEFMLRCLYNNKPIYVVPKTGYKHRVGREGSYTDTAFKEIGQDEGKWLIETARQEYFFKEDRKKVFGQE